MYNTTRISHCSLHAPLRLVHTRDRRHALTHTVNKSVCQHRWSRTCNRGIQYADCETITGLPSQLVLPFSFFSHELSAPSREACTCDACTGGDRNRLKCVTLGNDRCQHFVKFKSIGYIEQQELTTPFD